MDTLVLVARLKRQVEALLREYIALEEEILASEVVDLVKALRALCLHKQISDLEDEIEDTEARDDIENQ